MKKIAIWLILVLLVCGGCADAGAPEAEPSGSAAVSESVPADENKSPGLTGKGASPTEDDVSWKYNTSYTTIDGCLIRYVGSEAFQDWVGDGYNPNVNLLTFIQKFGLTKEEFLEVTKEMPDNAALSAEEIDALYSGDQAEINRTFVSDYAVVSEDGNIYTIFWLAEHDAADYLAAGLNAADIERAAAACAEAGLDDFAASVRESLAAFDDIETARVYTDDSVDLAAIGGSGIDWAYAFRYYTIPGDLICYVGSAEFDAWVREDDTAPHHMQACIEHFHLTAEDVLQALDPPVTTEYAEYLTVSDVETLCGGDQAEINRTFVSDYAVVSGTGNIYTVFWLAEHDAADYLAAGLNAADIERAAEACGKLGIVEPYLVSVRETLAKLSGNTDGP